LDTFSVRWQRFTTHLISSNRNHKEINNKTEYAGLNGVTLRISILTIHSARANCTKTHPENADESAESWKPKSINNSQKSFEAALQLKLKKHLNR